jgi:hypothetical protein
MSTVSIIKDARVGAIGVGHYFEKGKFFEPHHLQVMLQFFPCAGGSRAVLFFPKEFLLQSSALLPEDLIFLGHFYHHLPLIIGVDFLLRLLLDGSRILSKLLDDISDYLDQFCLYGLVHLEDEIDIVASVASLDGNAK